MFYFITTSSSFGWLTSSFMPVSSSIMTQASIGSAISLPLLFRCSSSPVPKAGFSVHESKNRESRGSTGSQKKRGHCLIHKSEETKQVLSGVEKKKSAWSGIQCHQACCWSGWQISRSAALPQARFWRPPFKVMSNNNHVFLPDTLPLLWLSYISHETRMWTFQWNLETELWSPLQYRLVLIRFTVLLWCEKLSLCSNKQANTRGWEKAHTNPGGCDVRRTGGVCGARESSPHAGRSGLSGLDHMCLEGVRGSKKKKKKACQRVWRGDMMFAERKIWLHLEG